MKRLLGVILAIIMVLGAGITVSAEDAYMGFSVSEGWYVFSHNIASCLKFLISISLSSTISLRFISSLFRGYGSGILNSSKCVIGKSETTYIFSERKIASSTS